MNSAGEKASARPFLSAASAALGLLTACGGGDSVLQQEAPSEPTAQEVAAIALVDSIRAHRVAVVPFFYGLEDEFAEVPRIKASGRCNGGGAVQVTLDGSTVGEATELPAGNHIFAVTHDQCEYHGGLGGIGLHGSASAAYRRGEAEGSKHEIAADVLASGGVRAKGDVSARFGDITAYGSGTFTRRRTSSEGYSATWALAPGARLVNNRTNGVVVLNAGSYTISFPPSGGSSETWSDVAIEVKGSRYMLNGTVRTGATEHLGEILITSDGTEVARVFPENPSGRLRAGVKGSIQAF